MLMVSISMIYPTLRLLKTSCEVGDGAVNGLKKLVVGSTRSYRDQLTGLTRDLNSDAARRLHPRFWQVLREVESIGLQECTSMPLRKYYLNESDQLGADTVQVQLCEWRQFQDDIERRK